jgi:hypothetical protein
MLKTTAVKDKYLGRQISQLPVQTKLDGFFRPTLLHPKTSTASEPPIDE